MELHARRQARTGHARGVAVGFARSAAEIESVQRLRYRVFAEEMGARLDAARRIDRDAFDPYCEHLMARDLPTGEVVGTYRLLSPQGARAAGGYYSEQEFDIAAIRHLGDGLLEVGRSCVHPAYRSGGVILLLWSALAGYMLRHRHTHLFGCASISMADGGRNAALIWRRLQARQAGHAGYRVVPRCPLPVDHLLAGGNGSEEPVLPPLLRGYLNAGARPCGEPAWDPDFNTADIPVLLSLHDMDSRHRRHFGLHGGS